MKLIEVYMKLIGRYLLRKRLQTRSLAPLSSKIKKEVFRVSKNKQNVPKHVFKGTTNIKPW